jgi:stage V sporulation protein R
MLTASYSKKFPAELKEMKYEIERHARTFGLDFFPVIFEVLDYQEMNEVAAYSGFPHRYQHWRFGMSYEELSKSYRFGLSKIYEMVINNDPCYAYLLRCNHLVDQKLVIGHVYAHCDFFKNNLFFSHTDRKMIDEMANHATRIQRYIDRYGMEGVESFIDTCLSLENLVDAHTPAIKRREDIHAADREDAARRSRLQPRLPFSDAESSGGKKPPLPSRREAADEEAFWDEEDDYVEPGRLTSKAYMDSYINPPEFLKSRAEDMKARRREKKRFPENPEPDILLFLIDHAPLKNWQRDVLSMIREEAYYFLPQAQTKIMNEGWATYWHSRIMTEKVLEDHELIDYADHHSGTLGGSRLSLNPYKLGVDLFRDIEERWNKGRFGKEYEECDDLTARARWDTGLGQSRQKIFEVRRLYNDLTFLDTFLTEDFCRQHKLFVYAKDDRSQDWIIKSREFSIIKAALLDQLTNIGHPIIRVVDANFENRGELLLYHQHEGRDLKWDFAKDTLKNLQHIWKRPVHVETKRGNRAGRICFDGKAYVEHGLD